MSKDNNFRSLSLNQKIAKVEEIYIWSPKLRDLIKLMNHYREFSKIAAEPKSMLIMGQQGAGKTKLIERYMEGFPRIVTIEKTIVPVLAADVMVPATINSLVSDLLAALGDPAAEKGSITSRTRRLCELLKKCETEQLILDEFQHFRDRDSLKVLKTISDWLKVLMNRTKLSIVLIGMPNSESVLDTKGNEQLRRRFSARERLEPFAWGESYEEQRDMIMFLENLDKALFKLLPKDSNLADEETASLIHEATGGVIDQIMKLVRGAAESALNQGLERVDLELLSDSYAEHLAEDMPEGSINPFYVEATEEKPPKKRKSRKAAKLRTAEKAMGKRVRASKKRSSLPEILSGR
jgi:type II secretory pathway predicted ATPase ExeA